MHCRHVVKKPPLNQKTLRKMIFHYVLWPGDDFAALSDEFVVRGCRVRLMGSSLSVECEPDQVTVAATVAKEYVLALGPARLMPLEEYAAMPARAVIIRGRTSRETSHDRARLKEARRSIVDHARLRQCYDYLQSATDDTEQALIHIYKLVETIGAEYGGKKKAARAVDDGGVIKRLTTQANKPDHDERHAPDPGATRPIDAASLAASVRDAHDLVRKYEQAIAAGR